MVKNSPGRDLQVDRVDRDDLAVGLAQRRQPDVRKSGRVPGSRGPADWVICSTAYNGRQAGRGDPTPRGDFGLGQSSESALAHAVRDPFRNRVRRADAGRDRGGDTHRGERASRPATARGPRRPTPSTRSSTSSSLPAGADNVCTTTRAASRAGARRTITSVARSGSSRPPSSAGPKARISAVVTASGRAIGHPDLGHARPSAFGDEADQGGGRGGDDGHAGGRERDQDEGDHGAEPRGDRRQARAGARPRRGGRGRRRGRARRVRGCPGCRSGRRRARRSRVPPTQQGYEGSVAPIMNAGSKRPPPRLAAAQEKSIIAWAISERRSGPPGREGARATPIGMYRAFSRTPAAIAAAASPPAARTAAAANCADPANSGRRHYDRRDRSHHWLGEDAERDPEQEPLRPRTGCPCGTPSRKAGLLAQPHGK